jgi:hypothetical protein
MEGHGRSKGRTEGAYQGFDWFRRESSRRRANNPQGSQGRFEGQMDDAIDKEAWTREVLLDSGESLVPETLRNPDIIEIVPQEYRDQYMVDLIEAMPQEQIVYQNSDAITIITQLLHLEPKGSYSINMNLPSVEPPIS